MAAKHTCEDDTVAHGKPIAVGLDCSSASAVFALDKGKRVVVIDRDDCHMLATLTYHLALEALVNTILSRRQVPHHNHLVPDILLRGGRWTTRTQRQFLDKCLP